MKSSGLQETIVAHLRAAGRPESSRDLARRFLRIEQGGEETCRLLLAPVLQAVPGVVHDPGVGWTILKRRDVPPDQDGATRASGADPSPSPASATQAVSSQRASAPIGDFVALASDGAGPGGSGQTRAVCILPVLGGEPCAPELFPAGGIGRAWG